MRIRFACGASAVSLLIFCFILCACENRQARAVFNEAEPMLADRPEEALALLQTVDSTALNTGRLKADYALLYAMALDKSWIDTTDVDVVMPAVRYYGHRRPVSRRAKPYYYLGRIQYNGGHYDEAVISFTRAKEYAEKLNDYRFKALIYQALADTYNITYLFEEALPFCQQAYRYCLLAKDTALANASLFSIAIVQNNLKHYAEADTLFNILLQTEQINSNTTPRILADYAQMLTSREMDFERALHLFEQSLSYGKGFVSYNHWGAYAYCLFMTGNREKSEQIFSDLEKAGLKEEYVYLIWKSKVEQKEGNYRDAFEFLNGSAQEQTEGMMKLLRQSAIKAQRDYLELENRTVKQEAFQQKTINALLFLLFLTLVIFGTFIRRHYKERIARQNQDLMETVSDMIAQRQLNQEKQKDIERLHEELGFIRAEQILLKQEYFHLSQENFRELSALCNSYYKNEGHASQANSVCGEVRGYLKNLGIGGDRYPDLEKRVNEYFGQVMAHFREEHPNHREPFFQTACYLFAGFKIRTIALVLNRSEQNLYKEKSLLRKEIEAEETPHQSDFLILLGGSST